MVNCPDAPRGSLTVKGWREWMGHREFQKKNSLPWFGEFNILGCTLCCTERSIRQMEHEFPEGYVHMQNTYGFQRSEKKFNQGVGSSKQYAKLVKIRAHISSSVLGEICAINQRLALVFNCSAWRQCWRLALRLKVWRQALAPDATSHMPQQLSVLDKIFQFRAVLFQFQL